MNLETKPVFLLPLSGQLGTFFKENEGSRQTLWGERSTHTKKDPKISGLNFPNGTANSHKLLLVFIHYSIYHH